MQKQKSQSTTNQPFTRCTALPRRHTLLGGALLLIFAFLYYGSYYRSGLNLGGEGGTVALIAMRLMEGQRPITDTFLGYNLMWFYPIVWLFKVFGPSYIALRIFFFALCTITGLLAYLTLCRSTRNVWYSAFVSLLPILVPGMLFRNYLPFLAVLNMTMALWLFNFNSNTSRLVPAILSGLALGLTYLTRIDLGIFASIVFVGGLLLNLIKPESSFIKKAKASGVQLIIISLIAILTHIPFYIDAHARGFDQRFLEQYPLWYGLIRYNLQQQLDHLTKRKAEPEPASATTSTASPNEQLPTAPTAPTSSSEAITPTNSSHDQSEAETELLSEASNSAQPGKLLQRHPLKDLFRYKNFFNQSSIWSLYLPIPLATILIFAGLVLLVRGCIQNRIDLFALGTELGISTGVALVLFPQYFFFRPDPPHLSEFMVPFYIALGIGAYAAFRSLVKTRSWLQRLALAAFIFSAGFNAFCAVFYTIQRESTGSCYARFGRTSELIAENGVHVFLKPQEQQELQRLHDLVMQYSGPDDYVICFPYSPTINFMTNRRSYLWNLYIDDVTAPADFYKQTVESLKQYQPAIIIIDNRDINRSDCSRFTSWAAKTYRYIQNNYVLIGTAAGNEIFVRSDKAGAH